MKGGEGGVITWPWLKQTKKECGWGSGLSRYGNICIFFFFNGKKNIAKRLFLRGRGTFGFSLSVGGNRDVVVVVVVMLQSKLERGKER